jgi:hypothetical protein
MFFVSVEFLLFRAPGAVALLVSVSSRFNATIWTIELQGDETFRHAIYRQFAGSNPQEHCNSQKIYSGIAFHSFTLCILQLH